MSDTAVRNEDYRFTNCDQCDRDVPCPYEVCLPRPSDPTEMACVLCFCTDCVTSGKVVVDATAPNPEGGMALSSEWHDWCLANGMTHG